VTLSVVQAVLLGYFLGSVPTAFFLVHWKSRVDIRHAGSGNVGALNSFKVTGSHWVGAAVLLLDLVKGLLAVFLARVLWGDGFACVGAAGLGAVAGHNFPVWLRFRGGRGLATAVGVMLLVAWMFVPLWVLLWVAAFLAVRDVNMGNAAACVVGLGATVLLPDSILELFLTADIPRPGFRLFAGLLFVLLLMKLADPVRLYFHKRNGHS